MDINDSIAILEVNPGVGGDEAKIWMKDLLDSYLRFAAKEGFAVTHLEAYVVRIKGPNAFGLFRNETGVHRVQRIPATEKRGRLHTSTAVVVVYPFVAETQARLNENELEWQFYRSGGHGGQNVNKVSTAVRLIHKPTEIMVTCSQERTQQANRQIALQLLASKLYQLHEEERKGLVYSYVKNRGTGDRAEKIRTYNFPQNRLTDHRSGKSYHNLSAIIEQGRWDGVLLEV